MAGQVEGLPVTALFCILGTIAFFAVLFLGIEAGTRPRGEPPLWRRKQ